MGFRDTKDDLDSKSSSVGNTLISYNIHMIIVPGDFVGVMPLPMSTFDFPFFFACIFTSCVETS